MGCYQSREHYEWRSSELAISEFLTYTQLASLSLEFTCEQVKKLSRGSVIPKGSVPILPMVLRIKVTPALLRMFSEFGQNKPEILSDKTTTGLLVDKILMFAALICNGSAQEKLEALFAIYDKSRGGYMTTNEAEGLLRDCLWVHLKLIPEHSAEHAVNFVQGERLKEYSAVLQSMFKPAVENFTRQLMYRDRIGFGEFVDQMNGNHLKMLLDGSELRRFLIKRLERTLL